MVERIFLGRWVATPRIYGSTSMSGRGRLIDPVILPHRGPGFLLSGAELDPQTVDGESVSTARSGMWLPVERQGGE